MFNPICLIGSCETDLFESFCSFILCLSTPLSLPRGEFSILEMLFCLMTLLNGICLLMLLSTELVPLWLEVFL